MSTYKDTDFAEMLFPFHRVNKNLLKVFPKLAELFADIPEFDDNGEPIPDDKFIPDDEIILYVAYAYDKGSPLQKLESITERKVQAALMAGIAANKEGAFPNDMNNVFRCKDRSVNEMIVRYCRLISSRLYSVIVVGNETMNSTIKELMNYVPSGTKILEQTELKLKLLAQAKETADDMDKLCVGFLRDDNKNLNQYLYMVTNKLTNYINLTPEDYSKVPHEPHIFKAES